MHFIDFFNRLKGLQQAEQAIKKEMSVLTTEFMVEHNSYEGDRFWLKLAQQDKIKTVIFYHMNHECGLKAAKQYIDALLLDPLLLNQNKDTTP